MSHNHRGGVAIAIVNDLNDPLSEGRIGLRYPWLPGKITSAWAAMASPLTGKERGMFFMPEKEDEVLVAFEHGNFAHPYILGFLWNGADTPPESNLQHRIIKTPSGLQLRFEDDNKKIQVLTPGKLSIVLDDTNNQIALTTNGGLSIVMDDGGSSITLKGGGRSLEMKSGSVQIL
jgi:uncharacterized protein involved in type VI secretion and phage assembly